MDKFGRAYLLEVQTQTGAILTIQLPFTIEFDITRNTLTSANICQLRIFNLSEKNRNQLRFNVSDYGTFRSVVFKAGYGQNLPVIFTGNISQAWSVRDGVNFITQIECYDGGFAFNNGKTAAQFPAGTSQKEIIKSLAGSLPHTKLGAIGNYSGTLSRGNTYNGNTGGLLQELTGNGFFIDNGKAHALGTNEFIEDAGGIALVNAKSGLLGTPILEQTIVRYDMVFEPGLVVAQKIRLESLTESNFNGDYKITGIKHRGMISEAVCGSVITTGEFFYNKVLSAISQAAA